MWHEDYFKAKDKFCISLNEFESFIAENVPDAIDGHTDRFFQAVQDFRIELRKYTDFISGIYEIDLRFEEWDKQEVTKN